MDAPDKLLSGRVARSALVSGIRTLFAYLVSAVVMLILTHRLSPRAFGIYTTVVAASLLAYQLVTAGFAYSFTRADDVPEDAINAAFWTFETLYLIAAGLLAGISFVSSSPSAHIILRGMAGFLAVAPLRFPMMIRCWRRLEMGRLALIDLSEFVVLQVGALTLILLGVGPAAFGYAIVAGACTSSGLSMLLMRWFPPRPLYKPLAPWVAEARQMFAANFLALLRDNGSAPMLSVAFGTGIAGYYGWAAGVTSAGLGLAAVLTHTLFLGFAQAPDPSVIPDALRRALKILILYVGAVVAIIGGAGEPLTRTVFTARWIPALLGLRLLLPALATIMVLGVLTNLALAERRIAIVIRCLLLLVVLAVGFGLPATSQWGVAGYAAALLAAALVATIVIWRQTSRIHLMEKTLVWSSMGVALSTGLTVVLGSFVFQTSRGSWLVLAEALATCAAVFLTLAMVISRGDILADIRDALRVIRV